MRKTLAAAAILSAALEAAAAEKRGLAAEAMEIAKLLRCPGSSNQSLAESETGIASELKALIYEELRKGKSRAEIIDYLAARYGDEIRYEPAVNSGTAALWAAPWLILAAAGGLAWLRWRRTAAKGVEGK